MKEKKYEFKIIVDEESRRRIVNFVFQCFGIQSWGVFKKWRMVVFFMVKFSYCFGKLEWYSLCFIFVWFLFFRRYLDILNGLLGRSSLMYFSGFIYFGKELSDFIFFVFSSFLKNLGDFLSSNYSFIQKQFKLCFFLFYQFFLLSQLRVVNGMRDSFLVLI